MLVFVHLCHLNSDELILAQVPTKNIVPQLLSPSLTPSVNIGIGVSWSPVPRYGELCLVYNLDKS